ncbi:MAG: hypothetical protein II055_03475, partial [Prevotella sp.]|nr:hypothetical protein [Prevotella sp.]
MIETNRLHKYIISLLIALACGMVMPACASSIEDHMTEMKIDDGNKVIVIYMDDEFAEQKFT